MSPLTIDRHFVEVHNIGDLHEAEKALIEEARQRRRRR
jgi:hypothetical protein